MGISSSLDKTLEVGAIFTPQQWAEFAIEQFDLFNKWIGGASILDPTAGKGSLLFALIEKGIKKGYQPKEMPIDRLYGIELNKAFFDLINNEARKKYGIILPKSNYLNEDIFFQKKEFVCDILFGNPPWQNFVDLPEEYKPKIKGQFFLYDLIDNAQNLLLGGSRIDIAALVLQKTIQKNLKNGGEAVFFIPLSLLLNDGANKFFRKYRVNGINYRIDNIFDFNDLKIFDGVATRYGLVHISRNKKQKFPIHYERWERNQWKQFVAKPLFHQNDPLSVFDKKTGSSFKLRPISIKKHSQPRQGINTCGANQIFFFDFMKEIDNEKCEVMNKFHTAVLPKQYLYPLIISKNFTEDNLIPQKWVLLPYEHSGKPLGVKKVQENSLLWNYLQRYKKFLCSRKGILVNTWIKRGMWWAMLGVGGYSFYPYKIVWEAYGKNLFTPKIFTGRWQANQSLQAFMPAESFQEASKIKQSLVDSEVEKYLLSLKMEGTMNWAQPGKIKKFLKFGEEAQRFLPIK